MGYVYLFWGGETITWERSITFKSDISADFFGTSTANIGDINKDSFEDIAISATIWTSGHDTAKVYVYYGGDPMDSTADTILVSNKAGDDFGIIIKNAGDLNKDGTIDFCISTFESTYIYLSGTNIQLTLPDYTIDTMGDINGDGIDDIISGSTNKINIYYGGQDFDTNPDHIIDDSLRYSTSNICLCGDLNKDGFEEIMSLAPNYPDPDNSQGKAYVYSYKKITEIKKDKKNIPKNFLLNQNYPNPFNPSTTISYNLPRISSVELRIYDILGHEVKSFLISSQSAGIQNIIWDCTNRNNEQVSSGVYLYHFKAISIEGKNEVFEKSGKLIMVK